MSGKVRKFCSSILLLSPFLHLGQNAAKRESPLDLYPRAIAHGYSYFAPLELDSGIASKAQVATLR